MRLPAIAVCAAAFLASCAQPSPPPPVPSTARPIQGTVVAAPAPAATQPPAATPNAEARRRLDAVRTAMRAENYAAALAEAEAATTADPTNSEVFYILGNVNNQWASALADVEQRQQALGRAVDAYARAITLNPNNDAALVNLGTVYYQNGQFDDAQRQVEAGLKINPSDPTGHYILGTIHLQRDPASDPEATNRAQTAFETAIRLDPSMAVAYTGLATVNIFKKDYATALRNAQRALDLMPGTQDPYVYWAVAQAQCLGTEKAAGRTTIERINALQAIDPRFRARVRELSDNCR